jgi:trehalose 6-phosphate phosphatase
VARILDNLRELKKLIVRHPFGLITDIDGTIAPTIPNILQAEITESNRRYLSELAIKLALVAVVSGRQSREVKDMVGLADVVCIGHYGMEWWDNNQTIIYPDVKVYLPSIRAVAKELEILSSIDGLIIQDKWATISIHYNLTSKPNIVKKRILELLSKSPNMKNLCIMEEKMNIGIIPSVDIDKGTAVANLIRQHKLRGAIFLGDDIADVPAFRAIRLARQNTDFDGLAILVTSKETRQDIVAEADFTLDSVRKTETLLKWLVDNSPVKCV